VVVPVCLSCKEAAVPAGHKVLMVVDYISLIVGDPQGFIDQLLWPNPIHLLIIIVILIGCII
jgi:hypothetical protein